MEDPKAFTAPVTTLDEKHQPQTSNATTVDEEKSQPQTSSASATTLDEKSQPQRAYVSSEKSQDEDGQNVKSENSSETKNENLGDDKEVQDGQLKDLEANVQGSSHESQDIDEKEKTDDPNIVDWDGPDDPANPMNWPPWKIRTHIFLISAITFIR